MNKQHLVLNEDNTKLVFSPESDHMYEDFVFEWLNSWRNTSFLTWKTHTVGNKKNIFAECDNYKSLNKIANNLKANEILEIIIDLGKTIANIRNSILLESNILFDPRYIFISKNKKDLDIKYVYMPLYKPITVDGKRLESNLFTYLVNLYIGNMKIKHKANKELEQKLLFASENDTEELLSLAQSLLPKKHLRKWASKIIMTYQNAQIAKKIKTFIQPQYLTLLGLIALLLSFYFIQAGFIEISKGTTVIIFLLIILGIIIETLLLFDKRSPYRIQNLNSNRSSKNRIAKNRENTDSLSSSNIELHPYLQNRIASLDLLNKDSSLNETHWVIMNSEFIIGTNPKTADLILNLKTNDEIVVRIFQRAGTFYLESLSKEIVVKLEGRMLFAYQEYELADDLSFEIGKFHFKFHCE